MANSFPLIGHDQLASYLLPLVVSPADTTTKLALANGLVREIIDDLNPVPIRAQAIVLEAAARPLRASSPTSVTTTTDGTSKTARRETKGDADYGVYLTPTETLELQALISTSGPVAGAYTVDLGTPL